MVNRIILNETSYFGRGAREKVATEIKERNFNKALIVTDEGIVKSGVLKMVSEHLDKNSINYITYDRLKIFS